MDAQLQLHSVKVLTRALACLSRYSDDLDILAAPSSLTLSATNSSKSAYCRIVLQSSFFDSYRLQSNGSTLVSFGTQSNSRGVKAQLRLKALLSILRHKNVDSSVNKVTLSIREPGNEASSSTMRVEDESDDEGPTTESRMIVKLFCRHGVIKTHRLLLLQLDELLAPTVNDPDQPPSTVIAGPRVLRDLLDNLKSGSNKAERQLAWEFGAGEMSLRTIEGIGDLSTEVSMSAHDVTTYDVPSPPVSLSFHIREFAAIIAFAESLSLPVALNFTEAPAPLIIAVESGGEDTWNVESFIATGGSVGAVPTGAVKRVRAAQDGRPRNKVARLARAPEAQKEEENDAGDGWGQQQSPQQQDYNNDDEQMFERPPSPPFRATPAAGPSQPPPFRFPQESSQAGPSVPRQQTQRQAPSQRAATFRIPEQIPASTPSFAAPMVTSTPRKPPNNGQKNANEPLFLPESQLSPDALREIRESGWGLDDMNEEELDKMFGGSADDWEQDEQDRNRAGGSTVVNPEESLQFGPTPKDGNGKKPFIPLFPNSVVNNDDIDDDDETEFPATQRPSTTGKKQFRPLFAD